MCAEELVEAKAIVPGYCEGAIVAYNGYISFFGEVDPQSGCLVEGGVCITGKVLAFRGSRGSTVGPYIIYALSKNSKGPRCMVVEEVEPMLVAGCVLAGIPLYKVKSINSLLNLPTGSYVEIRGEKLYVCTHK